MLTSDIVRTQNVCPTLLRLLYHVLPLYLEYSFLTEIVDPSGNTVSLEGEFLCRAQVLCFRLILDRIYDLVLVETFEEVVTTLPALLSTSPVHSFKKSGVQSETYSF